MLTRFPEPMVARVTGVNRSRLADLRKAALTKGADWSLDNSVVNYTPAGLEKLLRAGGIDAAALEWPLPEAEGKAARPPDRVGDPTASALDPAEDTDADLVEDSEEPQKIVTSQAPAVAAAPAQSVSASTAIARQIERTSDQTNQRALVKLTVSELSRNPTILYATLDGSTQVQVRVRTNINFIRGMTLSARAPAPGGTLYHFEGNCPRWRGRY